MTELWLLTGQAAVGLLDSVSTAAHQARELCHQFRFIIPGDGDGTRVEESVYACGDLRFRVWATDLPHVVTERVRRYALGERDRRDWQICLSDTQRLPEHVAQGGKPEPSLLLPMRDYPGGYRRWSLVEVSPLSAKGFGPVRLASQGQVLAFSARLGEKAFLALDNATAAEARYEVTAPGLRQVVAATSWAGRVTLPVASGKAVVCVPPNGAALVSNEEPEGTTRN
jgi:hypothetical protein